MPRSDYEFHGTVEGGPAVITVRRAGAWVGSASAPTMRVAMAAAPRLAEADEGLAGAVDRG